MIIFDERLDTCPMCGGNCYYEEEIIVPRTITIRVACNSCGLMNSRTYLSTVENPVERIIKYFKYKKVKERGKYGKRRICKNCNRRYCDA